MCKTLKPDNRIVPLSSLLPWFIEFITQDICIGYKFHNTKLWFLLCIALNYRTYFKEIKRKNRLKNLSTYVPFPVSWFRLKTKFPSGSVPLQPAELLLPVLTVYVGRLCLKGCVKNKFLVFPFNLTMYFIFIPGGYFTSSSCGLTVFSFSPLMWFQGPLPSPFLVRSWRFDSSSLVCSDCFPLLLSGSSSLGLSSWPWAAYLRLSRAGQRADSVWFSSRNSAAELATPTRGLGLTPEFGPSLIQRWPLSAAFLLGAAGLPFPVI